jgi:hypothetical protein
MPTLLQREADLSLRAARDFVRSRVSWPPDAPDGSPIAVFLADRDSCFEVANALSRQGGFVVLALQTADLDVATIALEWAGDHGARSGPTRTSSSSSVGDSRPPRRCMHATMGGRRSHVRC